MFGLAEEQAATSAGHSWAEHTLLYGGLRALHTGLGPMYMLSKCFQTQFITVTVVPRMMALYYQRDFFCR